MKVLVISVHPDDETLGCGGTILKHRQRGDEIFWLILTDIASLPNYSQEFISERKKQIKLISQAYQFKHVYNLGFPTTKLHIIDLNEILTKISSIMLEVKPELIYTVNRSDIHTDHQFAAKIIASCTKSFRYPFIKRILMYECISETEMAPPFPENIFVAHVFSDISDFLEKKIEIMKIYATELHHPPLPRSIKNIKALARFRGSTISVQYAEAFMLIREII